MRGARICLTSLRDFAWWPFTGDGSSTAISSWWYEPDVKWCHWFGDFYQGFTQNCLLLVSNAMGKMHGYVLRDEHVPLVDLVTFAFTFIKARRQQNQRPLTGPSLKLLEQLQGCIIQFLHHACIRGVVSHMASTDVFNRSVPSRVIRTVTLLTCLTFELCWEF